MTTQLHNQATATQATQATMSHIKSQMRRRNNRILTGTEQQHPQYKQTHMRHEGFINVAASEATKSQLAYRHGAVLVLRGEIISSGHNRYCSFTSKNCFSIHAEMSAIMNCKDKKQLNGAVMYVTRIPNGRGNASGSASNNNDCGRLSSTTTHPQTTRSLSAPCHECHTRLKKCMIKYGLSAVYYTVG